MEINEISGAIVDAAIKVHSALLLKHPIASATVSRKENFTTENTESTEKRWK